MKKMLLLTLAVVVAAALRAQSPAPQLTFDQTEHSFGKIINTGGIVSHSFAFTNTGSAPLVISNADTSCKCTNAKFNKKPVLPGQKGEIVVTYDPKKQFGTFYKAIQVFSNDPKGRQIIVAQGEVVKQ